MMAAACRWVSSASTLLIIFTEYEVYINFPGQILQFQYDGIEKIFLIREEAHLIQARYQWRKIKRQRQNAISAFPFLPVPCFWRWHRDWSGPVLSLYFFSRDRARPRSSSICPSSAIIKTWGITASTVNTLNTIQFILPCHIFQTPKFCHFIVINKEPTEIISKTNAITDLRDIIVQRNLKILNLLGKLQFRVTCFLCMRNDMKNHKNSIMLYDEPYITLM